MPLQYKVITLTINYAYMFNQIYVYKYSSTGRYQVSDKALRLSGLATRG